MTKTAKPPAAALDQIDSPKQERGGSDEVDHP